MTSTTTITTADQAAAAETTLAAIRARLAGMDAEHRRIQDDLGRVLAATEMGDKRTAGKAGQLAMRRSGLEADRRDLRLTARRLDDVDAVAAGLLVLRRLDGDQIAALVGATDKRAALTATVERIHA